MSKERVAAVDDLSFGEADFRMPQRRRLEVGEVVEGVVVSIGASEVFVDLGAKSEGAIDKKELLDGEGQLTVAVGDQVKAYVVSLEPELILSHTMGRAQLEREALQDAYDLGVPVEGRVSAVNKGGVEVELAGTRAFCPVSQLDLGYCADPAALVGQRLQFRITRYAEDGRNIVLSRRALLQEAQQEAAEATRAELQVGAEFLGEVKTLQPFGAFVDIGGLQGLVHISEISHSRIEDPSEVLSVGQQVRVKVMKIERDPKNPQRERIGLSMRALLGDPWEEGVRAIKVEDVVSGRVVRLQPFGAFVEILPGVDGLIHISELSDRRVRQPSEVVQVGETVQVKVLAIDVPARRISLSLRAALDQGPAVELAVGATVDVVVDRVEPFGLLATIKGAGRTGRGLIPVEETGAQRQTNLRRAFAVGTELKAVITSIDAATGKIRLSISALADREDREAYSSFVGTGGAKAGSSSQGSMGTLGDKLQRALEKKRP